MMPAAAASPRQVRVSGHGSWVLGPNALRSFQQAAKSSGSTLITPASQGTRAFRIEVAGGRRARAATMLPGAVRRSARTDPGAGSG